MNAAHLTGKWGEAQAARYLRKKGYTIETVNYRTRFGELDIVARDRNMLVLVEVKTRRNARFAQPAAHVTESKLRRLYSAGMQYLAENGGEQPVRFDVIEVFAPGDLTQDAAEIRHLENVYLEMR